MSQRAGDQKGPIKGRRGLFEKGAAGGAGAAPGAAEPPAAVASAIGVSDRSRLRRGALPGVAELDVSVVDVGDGGT